MAYYRQHMLHGNADAKRSHHLLLGPWDHGGTRFPRQEIGGLDLGEASVFDAFALDKAWYDWTLGESGEGERPDFLLDRVTYFVAGANTWKSAPSLDAVADDEMVLPLGADRARHDVFHSGRLAAAPDGAAPSSAYVYDPLDTSKAEREAEAADSGVESYIVDQGEVLRTDGDGLLFHSAPFSAPTEISGVVRFEAWIETDVPDTDVNATLYEVRADGSSIALTGETVRLRHRDGLDRERMMTPGQVEKVVFERFYWFSRQVAEGSRLRLFLRPADGLQQQRHYNAAGPVHAQTAADARTATVRLHHSDDYPSRLVLPIVSGSDR
jgi:putative CocE/NonD family hydrolase